MYRIAFLSFDWNYEVINSYYEGLQQFVYDHEDTSVYIFHGFGKFDGTDPERGSFEIYNLPKIESFDAIVLQGNRTWPQSMRQELANRAKQAGVLCASINYPLKDSIYIGTDNYGAMKEITDHIFEKHHVSNPLFVNGLETSSEAQIRKKAFLDSCQEHGFTSPAVYQAEWREESGKKAARAILNDFGKEDLPGAVICCNDDLASGVEKVFLENGIAIPGDVIITGFDNREYSAGAEPRITSVDRDYQNIAYTCMNVLREKLKGAIVTEKVFCPCQIIYSESCGCNEEKITHHEMRRRFFAMDSALKNFYRYQDTYESAMMNCEAMNDVMETFEQFSYVWWVDHIYFVMNKAYFENFENIDVARHYARSMALMAIGGEHEDKVPDHNHIYDYFDTEKLLPDDLQNTSRFFVFYPIRTGETIIGYVVTDTLTPIEKYNFHQLYFMVLTNAIENVRKKNLLKSLNGKLDDLYVRDSLTGIYNRFGLERYGKPAYETFLKETGTAYFDFVDIDNMKRINDVYGHEQGDAAIRETSDILKKAAGNQDVYLMRYGGDEFLAISNTSIQDAIKKAEQEIVSKDGKIYDLSLSVGEYKVTQDMALSIEDCIKVADDSMYEIKKAKKDHYR